MIIIIGNAGMMGIAGGGGGGKCQEFRRRMTGLNQGFIMATPSEESQGDGGGENLGPSLKNP